MVETRVRDITGPGTGTLRTPFVTLKLKGTEIPLLDASVFSRIGAIFDSSPPVLLLQDFTYRLRSTVGIGGEITLNFIDPSWDFATGLIEEAYQEGSGSGDFSVQFGFRGIDDVGPSFDLGFVVFSIRVVPVPFQGLKVTLQGTDAGTFLSTVVLSTSFDPTDKISDIIKAVIEAVSPALEADIIDIPVPVGEDDNRVEKKSPIQYIQQLLSIAKSSKGDNNYTWTTVPGSVPGKTKIVIRPDNNAPPPPVRTYRYGRESDGQLVNFTLNLTGVELLALGGNRQSVSLVDPETKLVIKLVSTQAEDVKSGGPKRPFALRLRDTRTFETPRSAEKAEGEVKNRRASADKMAWFATASLYGDASLRPLDRIGIEVLKSNYGDLDVSEGTELHEFSSGIYQIDTVEHSISPGSFRTNLELRRTSALVGQGEEGQPVKFLTNPKEAQQFFGPDVPIQTLEVPSPGKEVPIVRDPIPPGIV